VSDTSAPTIKNNVFEKCNISISLKRVANGKIQNNYLHSPLGSLKWGIYIRDTRNAIINNNVLEGAFIRAFLIFNYTGSSGASSASENGSIYNNTIVGVGHHSAVLFDNASQNFLMSKNVIYNFSRGVYLVNGASDFTLKYQDTLFYKINETDVKYAIKPPIDLGGNFNQNPNFKKTGAKPFPYYERTGTDGIGASFTSTIPVSISSTNPSSVPGTPTQLIIN
jgi:parallel beta-helix repeat protein